MASVVIAGDTSGTCTLQAANAAGTTVLNLPTTSGTLVSTGDSPSFVTVNATNVIASANSNAAVFTSGLGNATAPAYSFTGDTNTGIFSPTADTIAFTEGGVESMRIDSSGNVGIGTAPSGKLHTFQSAADSTVKFEAGTAGYASNLQLIANNAAGGAFNNIASIAGGAAHWRIGGAGNNDTMVFSTGSGYTERGRFDSSGNFLFNSGYGSVATAYGCRAWVNFDGTGTPAIRASGNVSSITDNGTGDYTVNFTTAMPDANYSIAGLGQRPNTNQVITSIFGSASYNSLTTTTARVATRDEAGNAIDSIAVCVSFFR